MICLLVIQQTENSMTPEEAPFHSYEEQEQFGKVAPIRHSLDRCVE